MSVQRFDYEEFDLSGVRTYPLASRKSKARVEDFARAGQPGMSLASFVEALPNVLAAADFRAVVDAVVQASRGHGIVWGLGAHVIKTGLGPILVDLMRRGFVSAIATNGAAVIHDFEVALAGATSEDVDEALGPGTFGMADETGRLLNGAINDGVAAGLGIGQAVGRFLLEQRPAVRGGQRRCGGRRARHSAHGPRRDRDRHHPHASRRRRDGRSERAACAIFAISRRVSRGSRTGCISIAGRRSCCRKCSSRPWPWRAIAGSRSKA